ncbi:MAG TPA: Spy/CpxP family protein refolding chaperone [Gemmatimonadaceae bacterium]|jgi:protein CpxP|nr:Spy/CpxP family protein refolding chaperone [Gemmatimonadaceae bacterium]
MSRFYTIALGLALCAGAAMTANAQAGSTATKPDTTAITRHHNRSRTRGHARGGMERADRALFKGINLSSAQEARVDSIRSKYRSESKSLREQMGPGMKSARAARQSGDSSKIAEARQNMSASREKMQSLHKQEISEIRGVLTPQQQSTFDKNVEQMQSRMQQRHSARKGARSSARSGGAAH